MDRPLRLYGTQISYYTAKARSFLINKRLPYDEVLATRAVFNDIIVPRTGVKFLPVVELPDGRFIQDTSDIIDALDGWSILNPVYPDTPRQKLASLLFEIVADEWLLLPAMHFRWTKNRDLALYGFGATSMPQGEPEEQRRLGERLSARFAGSLPFLGVTDVTGPAIETDYEAFLVLFAAHLKDHRYLLGDRPTLGDHALMGPLYAHLLRDPRSGAHMHQHAPRVVQWIDRMNMPPATYGALIADDCVPEPLVEILRRSWADYWPVVAGTLAANARHIATHPAEELPRALGGQPFTIRGVAGERAIFPYTQWMWQRAYDCYHGFADAERAAVAPLLDAIGLTQAFDLPLTHRVARVDNRLMPIG